MSESRIGICPVQTPEGTKHYVTVLSSEFVFANGLIGEAIVGVLRDPPVDGQITPEIFMRNSVFVKFMHEMVAQCAPQEPDCQDEARRLGSGWIYIIDQRTRTPHGAVPPEDIIGALQVQDGQIICGSYRPSEKHLILSRDGFFQLSAGLHECLVSELELRTKAQQA